MISYSSSCFSFPPPSYFFFLFLSVPTNLRIPLGYLPFCMHIIYLVPLASHRYIYYLRHTPYLEVPPFKEGLDQQVPEPAGLGRVFQAVHIALCNLHHQNCAVIMYTRTRARQGPESPTS